MKSFKQILSELYKPAELEKLRKDLSYVKDVDTRDTSWMNTVGGVLKANVFTKLGSGKYGSVFSHPKYPYVLKIFMKDSAYLRWIKFAMDNKNNPYVPKIRGKVVKITPMIYAIRLEKLTPGSFTGPFADAYRKWQKDKNYKSDDKNIQEVLDYFGKNKNLLDLHGENIMMRGNQLVVIDPFYNWFNKHNVMDYTIDPDDFDKSVF